MADAKWPQVKEIFDAVLQRQPEQRSEFLDEACNGDNSVRLEVESLLSSFGRADGFMEKPAIDGETEAETVKIEALTAGQLLGHYEIVRQIGAGGMGEVYLAKDTTLGRRAAIKVLTAKLESNRSNVERFIREAKAASARNHPNIITIYDIASGGDHRDFIAMEYVEGETLRTMLTRQKLEIKRAVEFAAQIASGLASAHAAGIVHRDIKPENLMVAPASQIKILDFGLAKLVEKQVAAMADNLSTEALSVAGLAATGPGTILGTVAYMSPEQAAGHTLDHRTDIFSLGMVLYEMLAGRHPFKGSSAINILHAITTNDPPVPIDLDSHFPAEMGDILAKALAKDPDERYQHAGDFALDLRRFKRALESNSLISVQRSGAAASGEQRRRSWLWTGIGALVLFVVATAAWMLGNWTAAPKEAVSLAHVTLTPLTSDPGYEGEPTFSPDGQTIAYVSDRTGNFEIYLRQISGGPDVNITNNPADEVQPSFTPDGKQIAFVSTRTSSSRLIYKSANLPLQGGDIWVMPALGGPARKIAQGGNFPAWSPDGSTIIYSNGVQAEQKLLKVSASGGAPDEIPRGAGQNVLYPSYSTDGRWIVFEAQPNDGIYVVSADGGEAQLVARGKRPAWNAGSSAIIYSNGEPGKNYSLWQVPFSLSGGKAAGKPSPLTVGHGHDTQAAVSRDGRMIAFASQDVEFNIERIPFDAESGRTIGGPVPITSGRSQNAFFDVTSSGGSVVHESSRGSGYQIVRVDIDAGSVDQLTSDRAFICKIPKWSPDERTIAFVRRGVNEATNEKNDLWFIAADGANPQQVLEGVIAYQWMPNGREIVYLAADRKFYVFDLASRSSRLLNDEAGHPGVFGISTDGQWVIAQSTRTGTMGVEVFPTSGGPSRLIVDSPREDYHPFVSPSGRWLYYQPDHKNIYRLPGPAQDWRQAEPQQITNFPESGLFLEDPQISGDGRYLFYSRARITGDIWILDLGKGLAANDGQR